MHIESMTIRMHSLLIFCLGGCLGLFVLCVLLLYLAGPPGVTTLSFAAMNNRMDAEFVNTIATMLDLQISMYVLRGLVNNGAIFVLLFSCLSVLLYQLEPLHSLARCIFRFCKKTYLIRRISRHCVVPGIFCTLAVFNAYLCQPVRPFVFARWLIVDAPLTNYFLAALLAVAMKRQIIRLANARRGSILKFTIMAIDLFLCFFILGDLWPDMGSPIAQFVISSVHDRSKVVFFRYPGYHSWFPSSPFIWDAVLISFVLFATGAVQLGASRLVVRELQFRGKFHASRLFTKRFALSFTMATLTLGANIQIVGMILGMHGCDSSGLNSFLLTY